MFQSFLYFYNSLFAGIWFFVAFNILEIRVHPCPQNGNSYTLNLVHLKRDLVGRNARYDRYLPGHL